MEIPEYRVVFDKGTLESVRQKYLYLSRNKTWTPGDRSSDFQDEIGTGDRDVQANSVSIIFIMILL